MATQNIPTVQLVDPTGFDPGVAPPVMAARPMTCGADGSACWTIPRPTRTRSFGQSRTP